MAPTTVDVAAMTQAGLNLIQQALSIYDSDLRLVVGNRQFREMFGLPHSLTTPGASFEDTIRWLVHTGEYGDVLDPEGFVRDRVEQARAFQAHYMERQRSNGRTISVEGSPLPQGGWVTVYTDITAIKRQEQLLRARSEELTEQVLENSEELAQANRQLAATNAALEEAKRQLTEMEARTRLTAEMMPAHLARIDTDLHYTYSNRQLASVIPGRPRNIVGLHAQEALGDEAFSKIRGYMTRALEGEASVLEFAHEATGRRIRVAFTPDTDGAGEVRGVYILSMDVTEEAQARAALAQTRKRELAAQLTSGLAHDFSNLLTIIFGLQARLGQMEVPSDARELIAATTAAARRGASLLDRIAQLSGAREVRPEPVELEVMLKELHTLARPSLPEGVGLTTRVEPVPDAVLLDVGAVQDALLNLVLNARDALGEMGEITVTARTVSETWLEIEVRDSGPGFTPDALDHGFDAFFTTKGAEGSGLGLAMVYDQAKMAGGQVRLGNAPEGGAVVTMRLPLREATLAAGRLVLLVEDQPDIRAMVRDMLIELGHQVIEAESAEEAAGLAEIEGIGLILSDIILGGQTGADFVTGLKGAGVEIPMLLMSSLPEGDPRRSGAPVLTKPFTKGQLSAFLTRELGA